MFSIKTLPGILLILLIGTSCSQQKKYAGAENEIVFAGSASPHHIKKDIVVDSAMKLVILPGAELIFYDTARIIIRGSIHIMGDEGHPVILRPAHADSQWGGMKLLQPEDSCIFEGMQLNNGLIYGEDADIIIRNCRTNNNFILENFDALVRLFRGSVQIMDSYFDGNQTGEGLLIHETGENNAVVENCEFRGVSDAVEYLNVYQNGVIRGNRFYDIQQKHGDGIDLNGCEGIHIEGNYFENIIDFGIEAGNDKYGPSKDIMISRNIFVDCFKGVVVKGGSTATLVNNTFYGNAYGVSCMGEKYGANYEPNCVDVINSIFAQSVENDVLNNDNSTINLSHCLSDMQLFEGEGNLQADPLFVDPDTGDFKLSEGSPCIGAGDPALYQKNGCKDLGAICY